MEFYLSTQLRAPPPSGNLFPVNFFRRPSYLRLRRPPSFRPLCQKMFVPGSGETSPEAQAAENLHNFFTFVAVKIVAGQLESYNREAHEELMEFLSRNTLNDGDEFCRRLMRESPRHKGLGLRLTRELGVHDVEVFTDSMIVASQINGEFELNLYLPGALRIMEVRSAYSKRDFEWDNLQKLAHKMVDSSNTRLMREYVLETSHIEDK
ncbi:hypothetical protein KSP39_PZI021093 [Platanthera zijinensis]|uniref:Uncharacterized protein n=1 Tax=Platanthera zijinensis TaxID=2320716 RepID=A0AAP0FVJ5_9ASPA